MRIKRIEVTELTNDINAIIAKIYGVSQSINKNVDIIARELIKLGYKKKGGQVMSNEYNRCDTCTHCDCAPKYDRYCEGCPMWKTDEELPEHGEGCGCVAYSFDVNGDCPFYEKDTEETNGAQ